MKYLKALSKVASQPVSLALKMVLALGASEVKIMIGINKNKVPKSQYFFDFSL
jgi:hypothetical protein